MDHEEQLLTELGALAEDLIRAMVDSALEVREGIVMTVGPPPYRRLDADGRALAYVRVRPRKRAVRVDVSGLWRAVLDSPIRTPSASGAATLMVRTPEEVGMAVRYLAQTVERTREAEREERDRKAGRVAPRRRPGSMAA